MRLAVASALLVLASLAWAESESKEEEGSKVVPDWATNFLATANQVGSKL